MAGVTYDHVTKKFDGTVAVDEFSSRSRTASSWSSSVPPAAARRTCLRMLAGLEEPRPAAC